MEPSHPKDVEVKVTIDGKRVESAAHEFHLDPDKAEFRRIWFCESTEGLLHQRLDLLDRGIILRMRASALDQSDCTVKLRGDRTPKLSPQWVDKFEIEGDWSGDDKKISASLTADVQAGVVESSTADNGTLSDAFDETQLRFLREECEPAVETTALRALGPIDALKWKAFVVDGVSTKVRAEQWSVDDLLFLEFSIRVKFGDAVDSQKELRTAIADHHITIGTQQAPKTSLVLKHLAGISKP